MPKKNWKSYEEVATYLLNQFAEKFGLGRFEGKQIVPGECGTDWEIDAKGYSEDECHFVVVECKCHTKSGVSQALTASLAFVIARYRSCRWHSGLTARSARWCEKNSCQGWHP